MVLFIAGEQQQQHLEMWDFLLPRLTAVWLIMLVRTFQGLSSIFRPWGNIWNMVIEGWSRTNKYIHERDKMYCDTFEHVDIFNGQGNLNENPGTVGLNYVWEHCSRLEMELVLGRCKKVLMVLNGFTHIQSLGENFLFILRAQGDDLTLMLV